MKKFFIMAVAAIAALSSCTSEDAIIESPAVAEGDGAVTFSAYNVGKSRAQIEDRASVKSNGFGVFAFSQMNEPIESYIKNNFEPNFMWNQKVTYNNQLTPMAWTYSPIKYWPNNPGAMVSFYAYAPYFKEFNDGDKYVQTPETNEYLNAVNPIAEKNVRLILGYDYKGPGIEYTRPTDPTHGVDLMWGEYIEDRGVGAGVGMGTGNGKPNTPTGKAAVNLTKQATKEAIFFQFHHALSRVNFNVQVWADTVPENNNTAEGYHPTDMQGRNPIDENTKIVIKEVALVGKIANKGTLRLYDGSWNIEKNDDSDLVLTPDMFADNVKDSLTLDEAIEEIDLLKGYGIQQAIANGEDPEAHAPVNNYLMLIPGSTFYIQITYDVVTIDPENPKNSSIVTNVIKSTDINALHGDPSSDGTYTLEAGVAYNFHLNIGMTSVKFAANVDEWELYEPEVVLPKNEDGDTTPATPAQP